MITGLLQKATNAKQANEEASTLEKIKVEVAGSYGLDGKIEVEQLVKNLKNIKGIKYNNNDIDENTVISNFPVIVKLSSFSFAISEDGSVNKVVWIDNNNGSYTNAETGYTVTVGDTVKYETILSSNAVDGIKLAQLKKDFQDYSGATWTDYNSNIDRDNNLTWKILDVKDETLRLISATPTTHRICLRGYDGYNNLVYLIDETCDTLYSTTKGKSQNLKIEDIEEKLSTEGKNARDNYANSDVNTGKYGGTKEYTSNLQYPNLYSIEIGCKGIDGTSGIDNNTGTLGLSSQTRKQLTTGTSTASNRLKITQTYWFKTMENTDFIDSRYYNLFMKDSSNNAYPAYVLSSRTIHSDIFRTNFAIRLNRDGNVAGDDLFYSTGNSRELLYSFRPVIVLNSDTNFELDGTNTWKIK